MAYDKAKKIREKSLLEAAKRCFAKTGMINATIKDISQEAGISRQTFYKYFDSVESVVFKIQRESMAKLFAFIYDKNDESLSAFEQLQNIIIKLFDYCDKYPKEINFISNSDTYEIHHEKPEAKKEDYVVSMADAKGITDCLRRGQAEGSIRNDIDVVLMSAVLCNTVMGIVQRIAALNDKLSLFSKVSKQDFINSAYDMIKRYLSPEL